MALSPGRVLEFYPVARKDDFRVGMMALEMFDRIISRNFLPPRRQDRKENYCSVFRTWRALRLCARHPDNLEYVWLEIR